MLVGLFDLKTLLSRRAPSLLMVAALALSVAASCTPPPSKGAAETPPKKGDEPKAAEDDKAPKEARIARGTGPVAKVNGTAIARAGFDRQMDRTEARFKRAGREISAALETRLKENLIRKMVDEELIRQKSKAESIDVTTADVDAKFAEHKGRFGTDKAFASFLERTNQTEADIRADLEKNLLREKLFAKLSSSSEPSEADAKAYFDQNKAKYMQREQVRASHILLKVSKTTPDEEKAQKKQQAEKILKEAKAKNADFAALASKYSEGPTAKRGGDLGKFSRGRMVKAFEEAAFNAKVGEIIGPIETQFGFHVIKVFEKVPERQRDFAEVKDSILTSLKARAKSKATREVLENLKTSAKIEVLEPGVDLKRRARAAQPSSPTKLTPNSEALKKLQEQVKKRTEEAAKNAGQPPK